MSVRRIRWPSTLRASPDAVLDAMMTSETGVHVKMRWWRLVAHSNCFVASKAVDWMVASSSSWRSSSTSSTSSEGDAQAPSREEAVEALGFLHKTGAIVRVAPPLQHSEEEFSDDRHYYRFARAVDPSPSGTPRSARGEGGLSGTPSSTSLASSSSVSSSQASLSAAEDLLVVETGWPDEMAAVPPEEVAARMTHPVSGVKIKARRVRLRTHAESFVAVKAVDWLVRAYDLRGGPAGRLVAVRMARHLERAGVIHPVSHSEPFSDEPLLFRFAPTTPRTRVVPPTPEDEEGAGANMSRMDADRLIERMRDPDTGVHAHRRSARRRSRHMRLLSHLSWSGREAVNWTVVALDLPDRSAAGCVLERLVALGLVEPENDEAFQQPRLVSDSGSCMYRWVMVTEEPDERRGRSSRPSSSSRGGGGGASSRSSSPLPPVGPSPRRSSARRRASSLGSRMMRMSRTASRSTSPVRRSSRWYGGQADDDDDDEGALCRTPSASPSPPPGESRSPHRTMRERLKAGEP